MHAVLLSLLVVAVGEQPTLEPVPEQTTTVVQGGTYLEGSECCPTDMGSGRACHGRGPGDCCVYDWWGPMPQTCYAPRFGCYPGNNRHMHRYPAFHGYYYRSPYNYRHLFDYPWHAAPHEPMGFFTYQVDEEGQEGMTPTPQQDLLPGDMLEPQPAPPRPADGGQAAATPETTWSLID